MEISAGIIPYRRCEDNEIRFFVGHPGGPYQKFTRYMAFLKGNIERGEDIKHGAVREFQEESGVSLKPYEIESLKYLGSVKQNKKKRVHAFSLNMDIDETKCSSNRCMIEFPLNSGNEIEIPEIDEYRWLTFSELKGVTNKNHIRFYEEILRDVDNS